MVKSQKIAKSPEVVISFLESINLFPPKQKVISIFFLLFYAAFFSNQIKQNLTSVLSFFVFSKEETQKTKFDFRFIVFPFMFKQTQKTEKRKMTSVLSFFPFMYEKTQKRKNKNRLPFYLCSFLYEQTPKTKKTTNDFLFIVFPFTYENTQIFIF